jgi:xanthine dehydrogenase accessory factor
MAHSQGQGTAEGLSGTKPDGVSPSLPAEVFEAARALMHRPDNEQDDPIEEFSVSGETWWLECITEARKPVMLFGAGHVGRAVARALAPLPFDITWADSRTGVFPVEVAGNIHLVRTADPPQLVSGALPGSLYIVMTHSHQLDEDICFEVLSRGDFSWLGLIGSTTKRRRFVHRLEQRGIESSKLRALVCPIGLSSIRGKQPATIALSLAAQLMTEHED